MLSASDSSISAAAPGLGGTLTSLLGPAAVFLINSVSFLASGVSELFITATRPPRDTQGSSPVQEISDGFKYFAKDRPLFALVVFFGGLNLVGAPMFLYPPVFAAERFGQSAFGIGLTFIAMAVGGTLFSVFLYARKDFANKGLLIIVATFTAGLLAIALPFVRFFPLFLVVLALMGATFAVNVNLINLLLRTRVEDSYLGRVHSFYVLLVSALIPVGYGAATWLMSTVGLDSATLVAGIGVAIGAVGLLTFRKIREL